MRVGIFLKNIDSFSGGGYTFQNEIIKALYELVDESGHKFIIFSDKNNQQKYFNQFGKTLEFIEISKINRYWTILLKLGRRIVSIVSPRLAAKIFSNPFDILMLKNSIKILWFTTPFIEDTDLPYIFTLWDLAHRKHPYFPEVEKLGEWEAREYKYSRFLRRAAIVIVGTEVGKMEVQSFYNVPFERIRILPMPAPRFSFEPVSRKNTNILEKYKIPAGYLFYPAQFWAHKNHANLLMSLIILQNKYNLSIPLVLVGSDKGNQLYIEQLVEELGLSSLIYILGFVSQSDLFQLYRNTLALTYVTFFGPDNLPPLEAFALGTPVIASNISGAREQLDDAALLVDPTNPEEIAEAIYSLYINSEIREGLIKRGKERALKWTSQDYIRSVFSILDDFESIRRCWNF